jgi:ATP-dependent DNA helicase RecQ
MQASVFHPVTIAAMAETPQEVLHRVFGYDSFRDQQQAIIDHMTAGGDSLVLMPTGGGKSLCFQIPGILRDGVAIVVSPLIALMSDQVVGLRQAGVRAAFLNSSQDYEESRQVEAQLRAGELDLLYMAPERLLTERTLDLLSSLPVALFAIDEAHCVSQWGHDFRPEYRQLSLLHERFASIPRIALTATADEPTRREIIERLGLEKARLFISGFDRPNICYRVIPKNNAREQLRQFLVREHADDAGIVYCLSRRKVNETADWLRLRGFDALPYHAGMSAEDRSRNQGRFLREEGVVIVATIAFGMGIDKSNVRFVAHLDLPKSLESYYQETGRAGRDGLAASAWMAYGLQDVITLRQMVDGSDAGESRKRVEVSKLDSMLGYCEVTGCRRKVLLGYFGDAFEDPCGNCDNCLETPQIWDATESARMALSCVYRTEQRFGAGHVIDVLLGKVTERTQKFRHDRLSTYGIGAQIDNKQWRSVFRQLVALGYLSVDIEGFGSLRLTELSRSLLRGEVSLSLRQDALDKKSRGRGTSDVAPQTNIQPGREDMWEALRSCRRELAERQGVPPYVIFHDASLAEMTARCPRDLREFAEIPGVGEKKLERYGAAFLLVINEYAG